MRNIKYVIADPAGNITIFVLSPVDRADYQEVADFLLAKHPDAEQLGYILPYEEGKLPRMEMAGLEFCGNATRSFAYYEVYRLLNDDDPGAIHVSPVARDGDFITVDVSVSGVDDPVRVKTDVPGEWSQASMPLPFDYETLTVPVEDDPEISSVTGTLVWMPGISHYVIEDVTANEDRFIKIRDWIYANKGPDAEGGRPIDALGVMFRDSHADTLTPVVYVHDTGTIYFEGSCASGSTCTAYALALKVDALYRGVL